MATIKSLENKSHERVWAGKIADAADWNKITEHLIELNDKLNEVINNINALHGVIEAFAGPVRKIPVGWILCDGRELSKNEYPELFNAIGYTWGGSGANFRVPDGRSGTLKMVGVGVLNDPDRGTRFGAHGSNGGDNVGSYQRFHIHNHKHPHSHGHNHDYYEQRHWGWELKTGLSRTELHGLKDLHDSHRQTSWNDTWNDAWGADLAGSTRDNNMGVLFIIKT